jgi:hypothetical protein
VLALNDRADAIEQRARELATIAIERGDAWVQDFGDAPDTDELYEQWVLEVAAGAAYLDRWGIDNPDTILDDATVSHEQETQRGRVLSAAREPTHSLWLKLHRRRLHMCLPATASWSRSTKISDLTCSPSSHVTEPFNLVAGVRTFSPGAPARELLEIFDAQRKS